MGREASLREAIRVKRGVDRVIVDSILPVAEYMEWGTTVWVHRCLREKEKVRGVCVHHGDQICQRRTIGACFLGVNSEEREVLPLVGGSKQVMSR